MRIEDFKIGDSIQCKKDYFYNSQKLNTKDEKYLVYKITTDSFNESETIILLKNDVGNLCQFNEIEFNLYFYSLQDQRKAKLNKLYNKLTLCKTCKHWKKNTKKSWLNVGVCSEMRKSKVIVEIKTGVGYVDYIETDQDFGCILHDEIEDQ